MPQSIGLPAAPWTGRSLRSQPRSDLTCGDHVVLVVFQHPTPRPRPGLRYLTMHGFGKPQLGIQPSRVVVAPPEAHMACHQLEPQTADPAVMALDDLRLAGEVLLGVW